MDAALRKDRKILLVMLRLTKSPSTLSTRHHSILAGHYISCSHTFSEFQVNKFLVNCRLDEESKHVRRAGGVHFYVVDFGVGLCQAHLQLLLG